MKPSRPRRPPKPAVEGTANAELRRLALDNILDGEALRVRVARSLHDGLGQSLSVLNLHLFWLARHCDDDEPMRAKIDEMRQVLASTNRALERLACDCRPLRPPADVALADILGCQMRQCAYRHGIACEATIREGLPALPPDHVVAIVHILVRCVDALAIHAQGLVITFDCDEVWLTIAIRAQGAHDPGRDVEMAAGCWIRALGGACAVRDDAVEIALPLPRESVRGLDDVILPAPAGDRSPPD